MDVFTLKRFFPNYDKNDSGIYPIGNPEKHFGVSWRIIAENFPGGVMFQLECLKAVHTTEWLIETEIEVKMADKTVLKLTTHTFSSQKKSAKLLSSFRCTPKEYKLNFDAEISVKIKRMEGVRQVLKCFDKSMERFSDVVLVVEEQRFYVLKKHLASHSTFFDRLFFGKFSESDKSEVELKDIDPYIFQKFLEVINGEQAVNDEIIEELIELGDYLESESVLRNCEHFLLKLSESPFKMKLQAVVKQKMNTFKKKCYPDMKTSKKDRPAEKVEPSDYFEMLEKSPILF